MEVLQALERGVGFHLGSRSLIPGTGHGPKNWHGQGYDRAGVWYRLQMETWWVLGGECVHEANTGYRRYVFLRDEDSCNVVIEERVVNCFPVNGKAIPFRQRDHSEQMQARLTLEVGIFEYS